MTGFNLRDITHSFFVFFFNFALECESSERLLFLLRAWLSGENLRVYGFDKNLHGLFLGDYFARSLKLGIVTNYIELCIFITFLSTFIHFKVTGASDVLM